MSDPPAVSAFVPGHITGLFTVHREEDPLRSGSRGAGISLTNGVTVEVRPATETEIRVDGSVATVDAVDRVLAGLDTVGDIRISTDLPLGAGFGLSGGMALGTALAANEVFDLARSENELIRVAHVADVEAGTGLGDVVAQARGGMPIRRAPGAPPHGELDGVPSRGRVEYLSFGELSTPDILSDRPEIITTAGTNALDHLETRPTPERFMTASRTFAAEVGLLTQELADVIDVVESSGGSASMAMLGETVFALGTDLSAAGFDPEVTAIDPTGATILE